MDDNYYDGEEPENTSSSSNPLSSNINEYFSEMDVEELIKESLKHTLKAERIIKRKPLTEEKLTNLLSEYLNSFIILRYDTRNKAIDPIFHAMTDMEADALSQYMQHYIISILKDRR